MIMTADGTLRRRQLPHWDVDGHAVFITACLHGSLPASGLSKIREYQEQIEARAKPDDLTENQWEHEKQKLAFAFVDRLLDYESPVKHLEHDKQAKIVQDAFLHFADERYHLFAFVVMPSHHHWVFLPDEAWSIKAIQQSPKEGNERSPRQIISHSIQSYTATVCNRIRGATGPYWQTETFDHWIRDETELLRVIAYIENNPVNAGLVREPEDWKWSSARIRKRLKIKPGERIPRIVD